MAKILHPSFHNTVTYIPWAYPLLKSPRGVIINEFYQHSVSNTLWRAHKQEACWQYSALLDSVQVPRSTTAPQREYHPLFK